MFLFFMVDGDINLPIFMVDGDINLPIFMVDEDINLPVFLVDEDINLPIFLVDEDINDPEGFPFFLDNSLSLVNKEKRCLRHFCIRHKLLLNNELDKRSKQ